MPKLLALGGLCNGAHGCTQRAAAAQQPADLPGFMCKAWFQVCCTWAAIKDKRAAGNGRIERNGRMAPLAGLLAVRNE